MPKQCCEQLWFPDRADIQQDSSADGEDEDFSGEPFKKNVPGKLIDTAGDETFRGRQIEAHITSVYECRYFPGVVPTMRLKMTAGIFKGRIVNIQYVKVIREPGKLPKQWLYCKEKADS